MSRSDYYIRYYNMKKHLYRERYYEKRQADRQREELFRPYGGEVAYYRARLREMGFIVTPSQ